jgi:hypothetical protein
MLLLFCLLVMLCGVLGVLCYLGWQRIAGHLRQTPEAKQYFVEHILTPLLLGEKQPEGEDSPSGTTELPTPDRPF